MARKQQTRSRKTSGGRKKANLKERPKLNAPFLKRMKTLRDDLKVIIAVGEDKKGKLNPTQLNKAKRMKAALDQAVVDVFCVQALSAY